MNQELQNQFFGLLEASSSFKLLSPEQQAAIKSKYENATDDELKEAIQALQEDHEFTVNLQAEAKKNEEALEKGIVEVKGALKAVKRDELKNAEAADEVASKQEMQGVMQELNISTPAKDAPKTDAPKRKKFLGIF
jgi:hypothetical protein